MKKVTIEHGRGMQGAEIWAAWLQAMASRMDSTLPACASSMHESAASSMSASARLVPGDS